MQRIDRRPDRLGAVADFDGTRCRGQDGGADHRWILRTRIIIGDIDLVGKPGGDGPHDRALGAVAVTAAAEHHMQVIACIGPQGRDGIFQCIGLVRVVDEHRRSRPAPPHQFKAAACPFERFQRMHDLWLIAPGAKHEAGGDQGVRCLKVANQRQLDAIAPPPHFRVEALAKSLAGNVDDAQGLALAANRQQIETAQQAAARRFRAMIAVGIDDGGGTGHQQLFEQPHLGIEIGFGIGMIVEMIMRQVGKAASR